MDEWSVGGIDEKLGGIHVYSVSVPAICVAGRSAFALLSHVICYMLILHYGDITTLYNPSFSSDMVSSRESTASSVLTGPLNQYFPPYFGQ